MMRDVESSMFSGIDYDREKHEIIVKFKKTGQLYAYKATEEKYEQAIVAESLGKWWHANMKGEQGRMLPEEGQ